MRNELLIQLIKVDSFLIPLLIYYMHSVKKTTGTAVLQSMDNKKMISKRQFQRTMKPVHRIAFDLQIQIHQMSI